MWQSWCEWRKISIYLLWLQWTIKYSEFEWNRAVPTDRQGTNGMGQQTNKWITNKPDDTCSKIQHGCNLPGTRRCFWITQMYSWAFNGKSSHLRTASVLVFQPGSVTYSTLILSKSSSEAAGKTERWRMPCDTDCDNDKKIFNFNQIWEKQQQ